MSGRRKPPPVAPPGAAAAHDRGPRLTRVAPAASPEEAAAIVVAIERFISDTAPLPPPLPPAARWLSAALLEGIRRGDRRPGAWGDPDP